MNTERYVQPRVSIITPTYNHERFISACIESVLAQSYQNWEIIVVDDDSTDRTWEIIGTYAGKDGRIRPYRQPNKGIWRLAETYNVALGASTGDLIAILEGDDLWPPHKLSEQIGWHRHIPDAVLSHGRTCLLRQGQIIGEYCHPPLPGTRTTQEYLQLTFLHKACIMPVSTVINKRSLVAIGGFQQDRRLPAVDYSTWIRLFELPGSVVWIDSPLGYWRQSAAQATQQLGIEMAEAALSIALARFDQVQRRTSRQLGLSKRAIVRSHRDTTVMPAYLAALRGSLIKQDRCLSRLYARSLLWHGSPKRKLQGLYGLLASTAGFDMEPILARYERLLCEGEEP